MRRGSFLFRIITTKKNKHILLVDSLEFLAKNIQEDEHALLREPAGVSVETKETVMETELSVWRSILVAQTDMRFCLQQS